MSYWDSLIGAVVNDMRGTQMGVGHVPWMRSFPMEEIKYVLRPHYKWFPLVWYDVIKDRWWTDGTHTPMQDIEVLRSRVNKKQAQGFIKLLKED